jgi:hypothetical protein
VKYVFANTTAEEKKLILNFGTLPGFKFDSSHYFMYKGKEEIFRINLAV